MKHKLTKSKIILFVDKTKNLYKTNLSNFLKIEIKFYKYYARFRTNLITSLLI